MDALELVGNIRCGREVESSQERLYEMVREALLARIGRKMPQSLKARLDSEDVLHDSFLRAMGALDLFEPSNDRSFYAWVYSIAKNLMIDISRRKSVGNVHFVRGEGDRGPRLTWVEANQGRPESRLQRRDWIETILGQLKEKEAEVIRLHKLEGLSFEEIAGSWGKTPGAVQRFYSRSVKQFRSLVERSGK